MSEPRRFLKGGGSDFERMLLRSAQKDAPSRELRGKTLAALGLGAGVAGASTTATAAATVAKTAAKVGLLKWIGFGVVSGVVVVAAAGLAPQMGAPPERHASIVATEALPPDKSGSAPIPPVAEQPASPLPEELEATDPASGKRAEPSRPHASAAPSPSALTAEIASLDVAGKALAAGNAGRALQALDQHDRVFPKGLLGQEVTVLRIEALVQRGDRAAASRLGAAFLAAHPRSTAAAHVRSLIGSTAGPDSAAPSP